METETIVHPLEPILPADARVLILGSLPSPKSREAGMYYANPQNRTHVTEKPLQLMRDLVKICEPGGRILDPFCGAGTTVLASRLEGYEAVGIEVTDAYYKLGSDRVRFALESHAE